MHTSLPFQNLYVCLYEIVNELNLIILSDQHGELPAAVHGPGGLWGHPLGVISQLQLHEEVPEAQQLHERNLWTFYPAGPEKGRVMQPEPLQWQWPLL